MDCHKRVLLIDKQPETGALLKSYLLHPASIDNTSKKSLLGRFFAKNAQAEDVLQEKADSGNSPYFSDFAGNLEEAFKLFSEAAETKQYYSLIVIDMDIDDSIEFTRKIWTADALSQIIATSSHPDSAFERFLADNMCSDKLLILKKPFNKPEFLQAALVLSEKYDSARTAKIKIEEFENNLNGAPLSSADVSDTGVFNVALINEMTQRKNAEVELQNAKNNLESIFMALPLVLIVADAKGAVQQWNSNAETLSKIKKNDLHGVLLSDAFPLLKQFDNEINRVIDTRRKEELRNVEYAVGESLYFNIFICPLISGNSASGIVIMVDDITADHKKDDYLRQAQKMDIVGNLASGIAHDFNNVLGAIGAMFSSVRYSVQTAKSVEKLREDVKSDLEVIDDAIKHGSDMVDQLRALAKKKELEFSRVDLLEVVEKVIKICRSTLPKSIEIVSNSYCDKTASVMAYPSQIEQELLNLS
jgi:PAS domain S-box-containing protein